MPPARDMPTLSGTPPWAALGCEVEGCEAAPGFQGAYAAGELLEWLARPTASEEMVMAAAAAAATASAVANSPKGGKAKKAPRPAAIAPPRPQGPWARVQCRVMQAPSPYAPNGRLVTERCIPIERLRPRPPPPPADFLRDTRFGERLQLRLEGLWWDVVLVGVSTTSLRASAAVAVVSAPRYHVASELHPDVCGVVAAIALRPRWRWADGRWVIDAADSGGGSGGGGGGGPRPGGFAFSSCCHGSSSGGISASASAGGSVSGGGSSGGSSGGVVGGGSSSALLASCTPGKQGHGAAPGTKGLGTEEVGGQRVRAWVRDGGPDADDALPEVGVALGFVEVRELPLSTLCAPSEHPLRTL